MRPLLLFALCCALPVRAASEAECQRAFVEWMLDQQQQFSDRKASKMARRNAERTIDQARDEYAKQESFCQTMAWVAGDQRQDLRFKPREGEVHDFTPQH